MKQDYTQIEGKFYQECDIIILPTVEFSSIGQYIDTNEFVFNLKENDIPRGEFQHLYFISDKEIKDGDWYYDVKLNRVYQSASGHNNEFYNEKSRYYKIIATTDKELDIHWNRQNYKALPRPSNEFLKKFCELGGIKKVLVECVDNGYEVDMEGRGGMDEGETCWLSKMELKIAPDNTITIKVIDSHSVKGV